MSEIDPNNLSSQNEEATGSGVAQVTKNPTQPSTPTSVNEPTEPSTFTYNSDDSRILTPDQGSANEGGEAEPVVSWTASEFIAHHKSLSWYVILAISGFVFSSIILLLTKDLIATGVVVIGTVVLGIFGARKPRELQFQLDQSGLTIGSKHYDYESFRSFSVTPEGAFSSIIFMPLKRFAPLMTIYYPPEEESRIVGILSPRLPLADYKHDVIDRFMRQIRF